METVYIYGLFDPRNGELRYIGKARNPYRRYIEHLSTARHIRRKRTHRDNWIIKLLSIGFRPVLKILEECTEETWQELERSWIEQETKKGTRLTNISQGGLGGLSGERHPLYGGGDKFTPEHRKNMSISARSKPPIKEETRAKMRDSYLAHTPPNKGRRWTDSYKTKMSELSKGKPKSDNHNKKNSLAVAMMWSKRKGNHQRISELQKEYFNLFGTYNQKYIEYI